MRCMFRDNIRAFKFLKSIVKYVISKVVCNHLSPSPFLFCKTWLWRNQGWRYLQFKKKERKKKHFLRGQFFTYKNPLLWNLENAVNSSYFIFEFGKQMFQQNSPRTPKIFFFFKWATSKCEFSMTKHPFTYVSIYFRYTSLSPFLSPRVQVVLTLAECGGVCRSNAMSLTHARCGVKWWLSITFVTNIHLDIIFILNVKEEYEDKDGTTMPVKRKTETEHTKMTGIFCPHG